MLRFTIFLCYALTTSLEFLVLTCLYFNMKNIFPMKIFLSKQKNIHREGITEMSVQTYVLQFKCILTLEKKDNGKLAIGIEKCLLIQVLGLMLTDCETTS